MSAIMTQEQFQKCVAQYGEARARQMLQDMYGGSAMSVVMTADPAAVNEIVSNALTAAGLGISSNCSPVERERCAAAATKAANEVLSQHAVNAADTDSVYKAEYAQQRAAFLEQGMTETDYVEMRKIDDGILSLPFGNV